MRDPAHPVKSCSTTTGCLSSVPPRTKHLKPQLTHAFVWQWDLGPMPARVAIQYGEHQFLREAPVSAEDLPLRQAREGEL